MVKIKSLQSDTINKINEQLTHNKNSCKQDTLSMSMKSKLYILYEPNL